MLTEVKNNLKIMLLSIKYNIMRQMLNKTTFITNIVFMIINNSTFIVQWIILFGLKDNIGGYRFNDVMFLWAISATTYGLARVFFKKAFELSNLIIDGKLDTFLVQPKNVLLSVISSDTSASAIGDIIFGYLVFFIFSFSFKKLLLFTLFTITGTIITTSISIIFNSFTFWIIGSDYLANSINASLLNFSTYPETIFSKPIKVLFYTIIPVGFIAFLPLKVIGEFNLQIFLILILVPILFTFLAIIIFYKGLKRYSCSNLMIGRI